MPRNASTTKCVNGRRPIAAGRARLAETLAYRRAGGTPVRPIERRDGGGRTILGCSEVVISREYHRRPVIVKRRAVGPLFMDSGLRPAGGPGMMTLRFKLSH